MNAELMYKYGAGIHIQVGGERLMISPRCSGTI